MKLKNIFLIVLLNFVLSCSNIKKDEKCYNFKDFNLIVTSGNLDKIGVKNVYNSIINSSNLNINKDSNFVIKLNIEIKRNNSLISGNNTVEIENVNFITNYQIVSKSDNTIVDKHKFLVVNDIPISDDRFANFATNDYIINNFISNVIIKLEDRVNSLIESEKKCNFL